jgi:phospholipase/carboxylesterase
VVRRGGFWAAVLAVIVSAGCAGAGDGRSSSRPTASPLTSPPASLTAEADHDEGRLGARPSPNGVPGAPEGLREFPAAGEGSLLFVPRSYRPSRPAPFALTLHGCCGEARSGLNLWYREAVEHGIILLAPDGGGVWGFGDTAARVDAGLTAVFDRYAVDRRHVAIVGFSAGASYAVSLGLTNGDLFTHVVPHSPGGGFPPDPVGDPGIFLVHGTDDQTIPVEVSRELAPELERAGYRIRYVEYPAGHRPQPDIMAEAVDWFMR